MAVPLLTGLVAILLLGVAAWWNGTSELHAAESFQVQTRSRIIARMAEWSAFTDNPAELQKAVDRAGLPPDQPALTGVLLAQFDHTPTGEPTRQVALLDARGRRTAGRGEPGNVTPRILGAAWASAWAGHAAVSNVFDLQGKPARAVVAPVRRSGGARPWAVLVSVPAETSTRMLYDGMGTVFRLGGGDLANVDPTGVAVVSASGTPAGGRPLRDPTVTARKPGHPQLWRTGRGDAETLHIAVVQPGTGYVTYYSQPTRQIFADLRAERDRRELTLLIVMIASVVSIIVVGYHRERAARRARARLRTLLGAAHDLIVAVGRGHRMTFVSPAITNLLRHEAGSWYGRRFTDLAHPDDVGRLTELLDGTGPDTASNVRLRTADGHHRWFDLTARHLAEPHPPAEVLLTCHEIGRRKSLQDELAYGAGHDTLTGLPNRASFSERLAEALAAARNSGSAVAVLFIDLDEFKPVNDALGHAAGDRVLRVIADRLSTALGDAGLCARFGGDEFGAILRSADLRTARDVAASVIDTVQAPIAVDQGWVTVGASVGIAVSTPSADHPERLLRAADQAMYRAKYASGGGYAVAPPASADARPAGGTPAGSAPTDNGGAGRDGTPCDGDEAAGEGTSGRGGSGTGASGGGSRTAGAGPPRRPALPIRCWRATGQRISGAAPILAVAMILLAVAAGGLRLEQRTRRTAEAERLALTQALMLKLSPYAQELTSPERMVGPVSRIPWTLSNRPVNQAILHTIANSPATGPDAVVALFALDGTALAVEPAGATVPIGPNDPTWRTALRGKGARSPVLAADGAVRIYTLVPVLRDHRPVAMLVIGPSLRDSFPAAVARNLGRMGSSKGGVSMVDVAGKTAFSWNPDLIGQRLADPAELARIPLGQVRLLTPPADEPDTVTLATPIRQPTGGYLIMRRTKADFFAGILFPTDAHRTKDLILFGFIAITVCGLAGANRRRERNLRRDAARLGTLLHNAHDIVALLGRDGRLTFVSSAVEGLLGHRADLFVGCPLTDLAHAEDTERLNAFLADPRQPGPSSLADVRLRTAAGDHRWFDITATRLDTGRHAGCLLLTCHDITERRSLEAELHRRARHDALTGLPNRAALSHRLAEIARSRPTDSTFAVLLVDLDAFKPINDVYGHGVGDHVLRTVATRIQSAVGERGTAFRAGGDEFIVVLPDANLRTARVATMHLRSAIRLPITIGDTTVTTDATIGVAVSRPDRDLNPETVVRWADAAMYGSKRAGRERRALSPGPP
jgi:diguanylate cyclase (GGDEF)-like protein/PAS domain S-box-containing protein